MIFIIKQKTHEKLHASNTNPPRKSQPTDIRSSQIGGGGWGRERAIWRGEISQVFPYRCA